MKKSFNKFFWTSLISKLVSVKSASINIVRKGRTGKEFYFSEKRLSLREQEVLEYLVRGKSYKEIAGILNISTETVKKHASNIYKKTNTHNKYELKYSVLEFVG